MTIKELSDILRNSYENAPSNRQNTMVLLFGIRYAEEIRLSGFKPKDIVSAAGLKGSWATELNKALNLSEYVVEKN